MGIEIFIRSKQITSAKLHEIIADAEDPVRMTRLLVARIEEAILAARRELRAEQNRKDGLLARKEKQEKGCDEWLDKARFALSKERPELARGAVAESEAEKDRIAESKERIAEVDKAIAELEAEISELEERLAETRTRHSELRQETASRVAEASGTASPTSRTKARSAAIDDLDQRIDFRVASTRPDRTGVARDLHREISELEMEQRIDAKLEALQKRKKAPARRKKTKS